MCIVGSKIKTAQLAKNSATFEPQSLLLHSFSLSSHPLTLFPLGKESLTFLQNPAVLFCCISQFRVGISTNFIIIREFNRELFGHPTNGRLDTATLESEVRRINM